MKIWLFNFFYFHFNCSKFVVSEIDLPIYLQGCTHWGDQEGHGTPTSTSQPKNVQQFQFQTSGILFFMGV